MSLRIRVLVVDDHGVVAEALRAMLELQEDIEVVGTADSGARAVELAGALTPDVILMDVAMPGLNGIEATRQIRQARLSCQVVILSMHSDTQHVRRALAAGAAGYVLKRDAASDALAAIRTAHRGGHFLSGELAGALAAGLSLGSTDALERLSAREREVLQLLAEGQSVVRIAKRLGLSPKTVQTHRGRLMAKLGVRDLPALVRFAISKGLVALE